MSALEDKLDAIQKKETREMLTSLSDQLVSSAPSSMSANLSSHPARVHNQLHPRPDTEVLCSLPLLYV